MASRKRLTRGGGWGPVRARSAERSDAVGEPARHAHAKKDTRAWCKGKEGREHSRVIEFRPPAWTWRTPACEWASRLAGDGIAWQCHHEEVCQSCGKVLRWRIEPAECPGYPGSDAQKAQAWADAVESAERQAAWRAARKPVISEPQGYRRKRDSA